MHHARKTWLVQDPGDRSPLSVSRLALQSFARGRESVPAQATGVLSRAQGRLDNSDALASTNQTGASTRASMSTSAGWKSGSPGSTTNSPLWSARVPSQNLVRVTESRKCGTATRDARVSDSICLLALRSALDSRASREAEILVLRQQLLILNRKCRKRARLRNIDRLILVWLHQIFPSVLDAIAVVTPETVIRWHRRGFRAYWHWKSRRLGGRPKIDREIRDLIRRMNRENPLWGAPRIHGELLMLGIEVAESTVGRYMVRTGRLPSQGWKRSCAITQPESLQSICSWFARSRSSCSMAWWSFVMLAGRWSQLG